MPVGTYPLGPPSVSNNQLTVDTALQSPTRISRTIAELASQRFFVDRLFAIGGDVQGGAVQYETPPTVATDLYSGRDVQRIEPGGQYPVVTGERGPDAVAAVEKWGGEFPVTDEARDRNDTGLLARNTRQLANTLQRKIQQRGVSVLDALLSAYSRTLAGNSFSAAAALTFNTKTDAASPLATIAEAIEVFETDERGYLPSILLLNPAQTSDLMKVLGASRWRAALSEFGIDEVFSTPRVAAGTAYISAAQAVGQLRYEQGVTTQVVREDRRDRSVVKSGARFVVFGNEPYAALKLTGIA